MDFAEESVWMGYRNEAVDSVLKGQRAGESLDIGQTIKEYYPASDMSIEKIQQEAGIILGIVQMRNSMQETEIMNSMEETKPAKMPKNHRGRWDAEGDFSNRLDNEFSGEADAQKDDALNDKWEQLFGKNKKREPALASKKKKKETDKVLTSTEVEPFKR